MKQSLRNITLASAIIAASVSAMAADAPFTVTKVWSQTNIDNTNTIYRSAAASKGNIYLVDKANTKLIQVNAEGVTTLEKTLVSTGAITCDDAGNIIQTAKGFSGTDDYTKYRIYPADGSAAIDVTLPAIEDCKGRCDLIGRAMGDVLSEKGGVFFVTVNGTQKVRTIYIANGAIVESASSTISSVNTISAATTTTIANPRVNNIDEFIEIFNEGGAKANSGTYYFKNYNNVKIEWLADDNASFTSFSSKVSHSQFGWDVFEFNGVKYDICSGNTSNYSPDWIVAPLTKWTALHTEANTDFNTPSGSASAGMLQVRPGEDAYTFYVYQAYMTTTTVDCGMWKIQFPDPAQTSVSDIEVENTNAAPEYYNLQGVRVENPSNGLYIVKKGTKTYKQYVD